jgi:hypothetical protein
MRKKDEEKQFEKVTINISTLQMKKRERCRNGIKKNFLRETYDQILSTVDSPCGDIKYSNVN